MSLIPQEFESRCERLYARSISGQWDAERDLPWYLEVITERVTLRSPLVTAAMARAWEELPKADRAGIVRDCLGTLLTNLAVGEAFVDATTGELARRSHRRTLRDLAAMQSTDEARHERVLLRYVREKLGFDRLPERHIATSRLPEGTVLAKESWQTTAMLVLILEIAALASIQGMREYCDEPLMQAMLRRVVSDESRHISSLTLALRDPGQEIDAAHRRRLQDIVVLGWTQALAVTEQPVLAVSSQLAGRHESPPDPEWYFFRRMIAATLLPKLKLTGVYDDELETRLRDCGCPIELAGEAAEMEPRPDGPTRHAHI